LIAFIGAESECVAVNRKRRIRKTATPMAISLCAESGGILSEREGERFLNPMERWS
jgi:hypothetical protein